MSTNAASSPKIDLGGLTHHCYVIPGDNITQGILLDAIENFIGKPALSSPDVLIFEKPFFVVEDSHHIGRFDSKKSLSGKKFIIICAVSLTIEAQNALLKIVEEPSPETKIFIIVPGEHVLIPTLRSRVHIIDIEDGKADNISGFMNLSLVKRLELVKELTLHPDTEEERGERANKIQSLLKELDKYARKLIIEGHPGAYAAAESIRLARAYLDDTAPSHRLLLEHVALSLPASK